MKWNYAKIQLFIFIVLCYFYNFQNTYLRLIFITLWAFVSIYIALAPTKKLSFNFMIVSLFYTSYFLMVFVLRSSDLGLSISGAQVEMLTVFLFPVYFLIFGNYNNIDSFTIINKVIWALLILFLIDVGFRYYLDPHCFMNYQCRYAAKTIGFFSTTNVTGACIVLLILTIIQINVSFKKSAITLLVLILISTMARAAIAGLFVGVLYHLATNYRNSKFFVFCFSLIIMYIFIYLIINLNVFQDGSLLSKLEFIQNTNLVLKSADVLQILFGFGSSYASIVEVLGVNNWSPHIPFLKAFLYFGIVGVAMYLFPILWMIKLDRKMITVVVGYGCFSLAGAPIVFPALVGSLLILKAKKID